MKDPLLTEEEEKRFFENYKDKDDKMSNKQKNKLIPRPCKKEVIKYLKSWDKLENYVLQEKSLDKLNHNTFSYEGGVQMLWRTKLGHSVGIKAGYEHVQTTHLGRGQAFIGVVWKMKKVHKSQKMTYADYYRATNLFL
jgi:hypothetical protein